MLPGADVCVWGWKFFAFGITALWRIRGKWCFPYLKISISFCWLLLCKVTKMGLHGTGSLCLIPQNAGSRVSETKPSMFPGGPGVTKTYGKYVSTQEISPDPKVFLILCSSCPILQWLSNIRIQEVRAAGYATSVRNGSQMKKGAMGAIEGVPGKGSTPVFRVPTVPVCIVRQDLTFLSFRSPTYKMEIATSLHRTSQVCCFQWGDGDDEDGDGDDEDNSLLSYIEDFCFRNHA